MAPPRTSVKLRTRSEWEAGPRTVHRVRNLPPFFTDEPKELGGGNTAPNPMEYVLSSLNGCVAIMIQNKAAEMGFAYYGLDMEASGELDPRGMQGVPGIRPYFNRISQQIVLHTAEPEHRLQELQGKVEGSCPMYNMLVDAGIRVGSDWTAEE